MIIVVVGPSGSGKTTFIKNLISARSDFEIISVDVVSECRNYDQELGRRQVSNATFLKNEENGYYTNTYIYDNSKYGFCLNKLSEEVVYVLDYPGEYPECNDMTPHKWIGVLVMPPCEKVLLHRLNIACRANRINSAIEEYRECISDIVNGKFDGWIVVNNEKLLDITVGVKIIINKVANIKNMQ